MTVETEISTPVEAETVETSATVEPVNNTETPTAEPNVTDDAAGTETKETEEQKVYAGKYNSAEELEKGYIELQKLMSRPNEYEKKYNELLEKQQKAEREARETRLREANNHGFRTVEEQEAHEKLQATELEWYANYLNLVTPENYENARAYLGEYLRTGHTAYFNEAKKLFPLDFVENVANAKTQLNARLQGEISQKRQLEREEFDKTLANQIKEQYSEFLADCGTNTAKAKALEAMCNAGAINSVEDMQNFITLYSSIVDGAKQTALREYEAQKVIDETKQKAEIGGSANGSLADDGLKESYTQAEVYSMAPELFDKLYTKYGDKFTSRIK